jgi:hypothetical protein
MVADGKAPKVAQTEDGATYDPIVTKETAGVKLILNFSQFIYTCIYY